MGMVINRLEYDCDSHVIVLVSAPLFCHSTDMTSTLPSTARTRFSGLELAKLDHSLEMIAPPTDHGLIVRVGYETE